MAKTCADALAVALEQQRGARVRADLDESRRRYNRQRPERVSLRGAQVPFEHATGPCTEQPPGLCDQQIPRERTDAPRPGAVANAEVIEHALLVGVLGEQRPAAARRDARGEG